MTDQMLPADLYEFSVDDAANAYLSLAEQTELAYVNRVDVVGVIALEERASGKGGWRARVQQRLSSEGHDPVGMKVIADASKIFDLFRLPGGFAWTREQVARVQSGRLRVFAQNAEWALANQARVQAMLESGRNENHMRKEIQEAALASLENREEKQDKWESVTLRLDPAQARHLRLVLAGVQRKAEQTGGETFSTKPGVALGQAAFIMAAEWYHGEETYDSQEDDGEIYTLPNRQYTDTVADELQARENLRLEVLESREALRVAAD